jgi:hypothetical protein
VVKPVFHFGIRAVGIVDIQPIIEVVFAVVFERQLVGGVTRFVVVHAPTIAVEVEPIDFISGNAITIDVT